MPSENMETHTKIFNSTNMPPTNHIEEYSNIFLVKSILHLEGNPTLMEYLNLNTIL